MTFLENENRNCLFLKTLENVTLSRKINVIKFFYVFFSTNIFQMSLALFFLLIYYSDHKGCHWALKDHWFFDKAQLVPREVPSNSYHRTVITLDFSWRRSSRFQYFWFLFSCYGSRNNITQAHKHVSVFFFFDK